MAVDGGLPVICLRLLNGVCFRPAISPSLLNIFLDAIELLLINNLRDRVSNLSITCAEASATPACVHGPPSGCFAAA